MTQKITATLAKNAPDTIEIQNGAYRRAFDRAEQPFDLTAREADLLETDGNFKIARVAEPDAAPANEASENFEESERDAAPAKKTKTAKTDKEQE